VNDDNESTTLTRARVDAAPAGRLSVVWDSKAVGEVAPSRRVLLVNPLVFKNGKAHHFLTDWTGSEYPSSVLPAPMEFLYLHAVLSRAGINVEFLDASARRLTQRRVVEFANSYAPDLIVWATTGSSLCEVMEMVAAVRARTPPAREAVFGPSATLHPETAFAPAGLIDFVLLGEPEKPALDLAQGKLVENLAYVANGVVHCLPRRLLEPLDWLPRPARQLLNPHDYVAPFSRDYPFTVVVTSRGCPYAKCAFCPQFVWADRRVRGHSIEYVLAEIEEVVRRDGYREVFFRDQTFAYDRARTLALCDAMQRQGLRITWRASTRVGDVDAELLAAMRRGGCRQISYGFESSAQNVLDRNCKGSTIEQAFRAAALTRAAGIEVVGNFVIGLPADTRENLRRIARHAIRLGCDFAQFMTLQTWSDRAGPPIDALPFDELARLSARAYRRFYLRPAVIRRILPRLARPRILWATLRSAYRIITERQIY
jgi:radical SAM superfamily enzyme YgiQ (UPF0313 family)